MNQTILVIGATGMLGAPVAQQLLSDGYHVRLLVRDRDQAAARFSSDYELMVGDVQQPETVARALSGCEGVHINLAGGPTPESYERVEFQGTAAVARIAAQQGVRQLTYLSGTSVDAANTWFYQTHAKYRAEAAIRASGISYTIFRASWFMESLPLFIQGSRAMLIGKQRSPLHWVAAQEYAQMVTRAYRTEAARNKTLYVYGPAALSMEDALGIYTSTVRPQVKRLQLPIWFMSLASRMMRDQKLQDTTQIMAYYERFREAGDPTEANTILGTPTITLEQWCQGQQVREAVATA